MKQQSKFFKMKDFLQKVNSYIKEAFSAGKYLYDGFTVTFDHLR